ncbi:hypothetical protein [Actinoplanes sp. NPDC051851]|uniref:hypothetical protein n=1 Tax=Actinoplanes sp. NPDC051851 TaxID=3154753 RepID=UPI00343C3562
MNSPTPDALSKLATPGERLGWIFNDRNLYRHRYPEAEPEPAELPRRLLDRQTEAGANTSRKVLYSLGIAAVLAAVADYVDHRLAVLLVAGGIGAAVFFGRDRRRAANALGRAQHRILERHRRAHQAWDERRRQHHREQRERVDGLTEWSAATPSPGSRRIDVIGGTGYGWEAVLSVLGGSLLATRGPMVLVDFTGDALCGELMTLATGTGRRVQSYRFPEQLPQVDLISGLGADGFVDCLVEAMHGDAQGASRAERSQDAMLLSEVCAILGPTLRVDRLLAALRVLADRPPSALLASGEVDRLLVLYSDDVRRQRSQQVSRIEAFLHPLESLGSEPSTSGDADLTCLIAEGDRRSAQAELLKDLLVQWLSRRIRRQGATNGSLVLIGADEVHHRSLENLSALCERRGIRLVLFFAHLREHALQTIGGGEVALMRLGNHDEARQAAEFIGKGHRFVLSQLTRTLGGNDTHTLADTYGETETQGGQTGWSEGSNRKAYQFFADGYNSGKSGGDSWGTTRNWGQTESRAIGDNWSDAQSAQRVYEYTLEPRVLQDLPDYAMILVKHQGRGSVVQAVEVNPDIVTLPRVSMTPVELPPLPDPSAALIPGVQNPRQVLAARPKPRRTPEARTRDPRH